MNDKVIKELNSAHKKIEDESYKLLALAETFSALDIANSEGTSALPQHAIYIPTLALKESAEKITALIEKAESNLKEVLFYAENKGKAGGGKQCKE